MGRLVSAKKVEYRSKGSLAQVIFNKTNSESRTLVDIKFIRLNMFNNIIAQDFRQ